MADKIQIASFDIDRDALTKSIEDIVKSIEGLKKAQVDLIKQGKATDKSFSDNVVELKKLEAQYEACINVVNKFTDANKELASLSAQTRTEMQQTVTVITQVETATNKANETRNKQTQSIQQNSSAIIAANKAMSESTDIDEMTAAAGETLAAINAIKKEQAELAKAGLNTDKAFVQNAITIRGLQKEYNAQLKAIDKVINASNQVESVENRAAKAFAMQTNSIKDLREQNKALLAVRNDINIETEEGQALLKNINATIDENTNTIKANVSEMEKQKMGIGDYANAIREAIGDIDIFGGKFDEMKSIFNSFLPVVGNLKDELINGFSGVKDSLAEVGSALGQMGSDLKGSIDGVTQAAQGTDQLTMKQKLLAASSQLVGSSMKLLKVALLGTGIGAIVVLLGSLVAYLSSSEAASNKLGRVLGILGGLVSKLMDYLEPLGEFILDVLIVGFEKLGEIATKALDGIAASLEFLGFDKAAKSVKNFNNEMAEAAKAAEHLTKLEQNLTEAQRKQGIMQLKYQQDAEKLRQIRDNENMTMAQRIKANEDLAVLLREQLAIEQGIAAKALEVANLRIKQDGATAKNLDAQAEAMKTMLDISERITGQESEQLTNRVALQKEAADKAREAAEARIKQMQDELELYKLQSDGRAKSLEQQLEQEQDFAKRQERILKQQLKNRLISETEFNIEMVKLANDLRESQAEIAQANLDYELARIEESSELQLAMTKAKGLALVEEEQRQAQLIADARAQYEKQRFDKGLIDEQTYRDNAIKIAHQAQLKEIDLQKQTEDLLKERSAQNLEFAQERDRLALESRFANEWEMRELQIAQTRERETAEARRTYTDQVMLDQALLNINQQAKNSELLLEKEKNDAIWQSRADLAGALSQLLGEETIAGKAAAIAQATINTYLGVTKALATLPPPLSWAAAATTLAQGLSTVGQITGIKGGNTDIKLPESPTASTPAAAPVVPLNAVPPFATGGRVMEGVKIKRSNGDDRLITAKTGEVILNEEQQKALGGDSTFRALGIKGFATGGRIGGTSSFTNVQNTIIKQDAEVFAKVISDAVKDGSEQGSRLGTRQGVDDASTSALIGRLAGS